MTAPADWGDWLKPLHTGECRPCGTCTISGRHDLCAWRPGAAHHRIGCEARIGYLMRGTGPAATYVYYPSPNCSAVILYAKHGRRWHCTCECHQPGFLGPAFTPEGEWALW